MFVGESVMIPTSSMIFDRGSPSGDPGSTLAFFVARVCFHVLFGEFDSCESE